MKNYYGKKIIIAKCNRKGEVLGPVERWEAHEKAILHRAFTVAVFYKEQLLVQHRKHPVFDGSFDVTSSSHQVLQNDKLQDTIEASLQCLKREWNLEKKDIFKMKDLGTIYYKAKDNLSIYTEHEICNIVVCQVKKLPSCNMEVSYGYSIVDKKDLHQHSRIYKNLAPWVKVMIEKGFL